MNYTYFCNEWDRLEIWMVNEGCINYSYKTDWFNRSSCYSFNYDFKLYRALFYSL